MVAAGTMLDTTGGGTIVGGDVLVIAGPPGTVWLKPARPKGSLQEKEADSSHVPEHQDPRQL